MKKIIIFCGLLLFSVQNLPAQSIEQDYKNRVKQVLAWADSSSSLDFFMAAAKIKSGHKKQGLQHFTRVFNRYDTAPAGMFTIYSLMTSYLAVENELPAKFKKQIQDYMARADFFRGDTENHFCMYYIGLYLAAQTFPDLGPEKWYTGKSSAENQKEAEQWLLEWMDITTSIGQGEFDSPTYTAVMLSPLFGLYQHAKDPVMKEKAGLMLHWLIADYAVEHLKGQYVGAHSREYPDRLTNRLEPESLMSGWGWLFFGQTEPLFNATLVSAALSDFVIPEILYYIGTDRSKPYVHTETKRVRNVIRLGSEKNPPVYKYTYMTEDYALGSMMGGGILQPIQQHTWDVSWVTKDSQSVLFTVHPFIGEKDLGMFFPEEMKYSTNMVARFHTYYGSEKKWSSSSPYEQTFQHENAIIVLYDIPKGVKFQHIDGFFTKEMDKRQVDESGWIFCQVEKIFIAYYPLKPYQWIDENDHYRLQSSDGRNGCIVEVANQSDYQSFETFKKQVRKNSLAIDTYDQTGMVAYTTSSGNVMVFSVDGVRKLNGKNINFADYKLFNGPFLKSEINSQKLFIQYKDKGLVLDMSTEEKALLIPEYICQKVDRDVVLSGKMDDPLWEKAETMILEDAVTGKPGTFNTSVKALYNDKYLFVAFQCEDDYVWGTVTEEDGPIWDEECVEVFLNPASCAHQYYEINVSPKNVRFTASILNNRTPERPNDAFTGLTDYQVEGLQTKVYIDGQPDVKGGAKGYTVEYAIPFDQLYGAPNTPPLPGDVWRANFYRIDTPVKGQRDHYAWHKTERIAFHLPWRFGYLKFAE